MMSSTQDLTAALSEVTAVTLSDSTGDAHFNINIYVSIADQSKNIMLCHDLYLHFMAQLSILFL